MDKEKFETTLLSKQIETMRKSFLDLCQECTLYSAFFPHVLGQISIYTTGISQGVILRNNRWYENGFLLFLVRICNRSKGNHRHYQSKIIKANEIAELELMICLRHKDNSEMISSLIKFDYKERADTVWRVKVKWKCTFIFFRVFKHCFI